MYSYDSNCYFYQKNVMHYIIQENTFSETNYNVLIDTLEKLKLSYEIVRVLPYVDDIVPLDLITVDENYEFKSVRNDVFCFGSIKMARVAKKHNWHPGSLLNENHDYRVYSLFYRDNLLNFDSKVQKFSEPIEIEGDFFVRPCEDSKVFTGKVFNKAEWNTFVSNFFKRGESTTLTNDTEIQVCSSKIITKEWRFWVVGGNVVTGSLYRMGEWINYSELVDGGALEFCKEMVKLFELAEAFVIDICEVLNEDEVAQYKIVECGCINSAGFYKSNMPMLIDALETYFG